MKKLYAGTVLALALLFASQTAFAQTPCNSVCQSYYPCDYVCDHCVGDPGLWEDGGGCWGEIVSGTCGDIGQCGNPICTPNWIYDEVTYQGAKPEFTYDPCEWEVKWNSEAQEWQWVETCYYSTPYKCTVYEIFKVVRHQTNCPSSSSSQTFCDYGGLRYVGRYSGPWDPGCCWDSNMWNCTTSFPQCGW